MICAHNHSASELSNYLMTLYVTFSPLTNKYQTNRMGLSKGELNSEVAAHIIPWACRLSTQMLVAPSEVQVTNSMYHTIQQCLPFSVVVSPSNLSITIQQVGSAVRSANTKVQGSISSNLRLRVTVYGKSKYLKCPPPVNSTRPNYCHEQTETNQCVSQCCV